MVREICPNRIWKKTLRIGAIVVLIGFHLKLAEDGAYAQTTAFEFIFEAHGVKEFPSSILATGTVDREGKREPFRLLATNNEQLRIEYGSEGKETMVASPKLNFRIDGDKYTFSRVPAGFSQLDITGLFFLEQLRNRPVRVTPDSVWIEGVGGRTRRLQIENGRSEVHQGKGSVQDKVSVYISEGGVLTGISRTFYDGRPERYTQSFAFSDYRKTNGELQPYRIDVYIKSKLRQTYRVDSYQFGTEISSQAFTVRRGK